MKHAISAKPTISRRSTASRRGQARYREGRETAGPSASIMPIMFMMRAAVVPELVANDGARHGLPTEARFPARGAPEQHRDGGREGRHEAAGEIDNHGRSALVRRRADDVGKRARGELGQGEATEIERQRHLDAASVEAKARTSSGIAGVLERHRDGPSATREGADDARAPLAHPERHSAPPSPCRRDTGRGGGDCPARILRFARRTSRPSSPRSSV